MAHDPGRVDPTKVEELDDDEYPDDDVKMSESPPPFQSPDSDTLDDDTPDPTSSTSPGPVKRPRGRPRKHPLPSLEAQAKIAKGRSKTGCLTCRRRKKKCDETKPQCLNCQKNAVVCEGYPERVYWKSGRQRAEEARAARAGTKPHELRVLVDGVETDTDRCLLEHFAQKASKVLTLFNDDKNPFKVLLLPMAMQHKGLMHSLLCFSGSHLIAGDQAGFHERQNYHYESALRELYRDRKINDQARGRSSEPIDDPTIASVLILCLDFICAGATDGRYRPHLAAARHMIATNQTRNAAFGEFLVEFFAYHDTASALTTLDRRPMLLTEDFQLPQFIIQPEAGAMLGVVDGLFGYISRITKLRDTIRERRLLGLEPPVDYQCICDAVSLDSGVRTWVSAQREGSDRYVAAQLYRQCTWIYLYRTVHPSRPTAKIVEAVDEGLNYLSQMLPDASTQSILLMPVFLLGCAAFEQEQRPPLRRSFGALKRYSGLGNIDPAREVVERVWSIMDAGDESSSWDWETIIKDMGYDFLVT